MSQTVDVAGLLDASPWSRYQKLLTALGALAIIFDGFDIQILGFAIPALIKEWRAARSDFGGVLALGLAGMVAGGPLLGYIGDRFGRRRALILSVVIFGVATIATAFIHGFIGLTALRFLTGVGAGGAVPSASTLAAEFAPLRRRPAAVKLTLVCVPLGGMLGGLLAAAVLPGFGWRGLYVVGGLLPLLFALVLVAALPESPRFLARRPALWPQLVRLLTRMEMKIPAGAAFEDRAEREGAARTSLARLFSSGLARDTAGLWIAFFFCLGSIYLVFGWLPTMLVAQGLDLATASFGLAVYNFGGVIGVLAWAVLVTIVGSRGPMLSAALACAGSALALLVIPIQTHGGNMMMIACLGLCGFLANAVQTSMYALAAHVYPTAVRATGVAYAASLGRFGGLLSSLLGASIIQPGGGAYWYALAIAMVCAFAGLAWVRSHYPAMGKLDAAGAAAP